MPLVHTDAVYDMGHYSGAESSSYYQEVTSSRTSAPVTAHKDSARGQGGSLYENRGYAINFCTLLVWLVFMVIGVLLLVAALARPEWIVGRVTTTEGVTSDVDIGLYRSCASCPSSDMADCPFGNVCDSHGLNDSGNHFWIGGLFFLCIACIDIH